MLLNLVVIVIIITLVVVCRFHSFFVVIRGNSLAYQTNLLNLIRHLILVIPILVLARVQFI